jgi:hypothetical protein
MRENGHGHLPQPGRITRDDDGTISESSIAKIQSQLELITQTLNGGLRLKSGETLGRAGNFKAQMIELTTPSSANSEFSVPHSLGALPEGYIVVLQDKAGSLYTSNFGGWDKNTIYLKSDATSMLINVILYA